MNGTYISVVSRDVIPFFGNKNPHMSKIHKMLIHFHFYSTVVYIKISHRNCIERCT